MPLNFDGILVLLSHKYLCSAGELDISPVPCEVFSDFILNQALLISNNALTKTDKWCQQIH